MAQPRLEDTTPKQQTFRDFLGCNTQASRTSIRENQFSFLENLQPCGFGLLKTVGAPTPVSTTTNSIYSVQTATVNDVDVELLFHADGTIDVIDLNNFSNTQVEINLGNLLSGSGTRIAPWSNTAVLFIDTTGLYVWTGGFDQVSFSKITGAGVPTTGTDICVYEGRVWVSNGRTVQFSGPDDYTAASWAAAVGAGNFVITDSTLRGNIVRLVAFNGYMYIFGESSIDIVSDVRVPANITPPTPIFTRININAIFGTTYPDSVFIWNRSVMFANNTGFFSLDGVSVSRVSEDIDDTVRQINTGVEVTGASASINDILCACFAFSWFDPTLDGGNRSIVACYFDEKWFFTSQLEYSDGVDNQTLDATLQIVTGFVNNTPCAIQLSTRGANYQTMVDFHDDSTVHDYTARTALWPMGSSIYDKQGLKAGMETLIQQEIVNLVITMDSENGSSDPINLHPGQIPWINTSSAIIPWTNQFGDVIPWYNRGIGIDAEDISQVGKYIGLTMTSRGSQNEFNAFNLEYKLRTTW